MAGKGAPKKNQYAKKEKPGHTIGLYITAEELAILEALLAKQGKDTDKLAIDRYARQLFKQSVQEANEFLKQQETHKKTS